MKIQRFFGSGAASCAALPAVLFVAALLALAGCSGSNNDPGTPTLVSIAAETTKTDYLLEQDLELDTITVTGTYSDGSTKAIAITGDNIAGHNKSQPGDQVLTVTVEGKSSAFTITVSSVSIVHAQAPAISVQPQGGNFDIGAAVTLSVTAVSPDGGVLSYQWHSRAGSGEAWAAIEGAAAASYSPPVTAAGTRYYYVRITNTNNNATGTKTAGLSSGVATVVVSSVSLVHAQAPVISAEPQGGTFGPGETVTLSVTATSPDGGELSYQWHRATEGAWTAIEGATGASYSPPASVTGTLSYYVRITNTNSEVTGNKSATTNSATAAVVIIAGTGGFDFDVWAGDDGSLISNMPDPDQTIIAKSGRESLTCTAADDLDNIRWSINGAELPAPQGTDQSITIKAVDYLAGDYILGLYAEKDVEGKTVPYFINITFMVVN
jgi:hypothetical protein